MDKQQQHREKVDGYIAEGRTVSGGDANPPDKPGYEAVQVTGDVSKDKAALNKLSDKGYRFLAVVRPGDQIVLARGY